MRRVVIMLYLSFAFVGCNLPRDPEGTLHRVENKTLRVGVIVDEPWVRWRGSGEPDGIEVNLVRRLAEQLHADVAWSVGSDSRLMTGLEGFELDLVIGGVVETTAWKERVALTSPYLLTSSASIVGGRLLQASEERHVLALPPGENGWLLYVDKFLMREQEWLREQISNVRSNSPSTGQH